MKRLLVCLYGPSGSGKSTLARLLAVRYLASVVKVSEPLHRIQRGFDRTVGRQIGFQDGELLQFLASKVERDQPGWLANRFLDHVSASSTPIVINDDCRTNAYAALREAGFTFIAIDTSPDVRLQRAEGRGDHAVLNESHEFEGGFEQFKADYRVNNDGPVEKTIWELVQIVDALLASPDRGGWLTGTQIEHEVERGRIVVEPFSRECINSNSYNYHLAHTLMRVDDEVVDCRVAESCVALTIPSEGLVLIPGDCYLGSTVELFGSNYYASLITGRSSIGRKFITNHITAGLIDQGFHGRITLEITVQKPTRVYPNMKFGQIFWFTTFGPSNLYQGKYQGQQRATPSKLHRDE